MMADDDGREPADPVGSLIWNWGDAYDIREMGDGSITAERLDDGTVLTAGTAAGARQVLRADYNARPVPRQAATAGAPPEC